MLDRKIRKNDFTITPIVPSIDLKSRVYEFHVELMPEDWKPEDKFIIQWVNRHNNTIGVRYECSPSISSAECQDPAKPGSVGS